MTHTIDTEWHQTYYVDLQNGWPKSPSPEDEVGTVTARVDIERGSEFNLLGITFTHYLTFRKYIFFGKFPEYKVEILGRVHRFLSADEVPEEIHAAFNEAVGIDYTTYTYKTDGFDWL